MPPSNDDIPFEEPADDVFAADDDAFEADDATGAGALDDDDAAMPLRALLGTSAEPVLAVAARSADVLTVAIENVLMRQSSVAGAATEVTDYESVAAEFAQREHVGLELRVAMAGESHALAVLLPIETAGTLFNLETLAEQVTAGDYVDGDIEALAATTRELLELAGLMLFVDELGGGEAALSAVRLGAADETMASVQSGARGNQALRIDLVLTLVDGQHVVLTAVVPTAFLGAVASHVGAGLPRGAGIAVDDPTAIEEEAPASAPRPRVSSLRPQAESESPVHPARFPPLALPERPPASRQQIDIIMDVGLRVTVELGRSNMTVEEVLGLGPGSVVELNKLAGEPVDVLVNDRPIARGEVVVVDENFGVRVTEILSPRNRASVLAR